MEVFTKLHEVISVQNLIAVLTIYFSTVALYRLTLHPLARFPGPKLAAITRWYEAYHDIVRNGQYTFKIAEMHRKYGPILRISPHELHIMDPSFFEQLYRQEGRWDKYAWAYDGFSAQGATICTSSHELHKARRQPLNRFFSRMSVVSRQDIIYSNVNKFCDRVLQYAGETVNLGAALSALSRDISCEFVLNKTYNSLGKEDFNVAMTNMLQDTGFVWRVTKHIPWFGPTMKSIPPGLMMKMADEATTAFFNFIQESDQDTKRLLKIAAAPSIDEDAPRTIVHEIVESKLPPEEKEFSRVMDDVATITGAGFETMASVLRLIIYHVFNDAEILRRLRGELDTASQMKPAGDSEIQIKTLEKLPYLTSVIMEGIRLSPAIGSRMARISPDKDIIYGDWRIPAGTPVGMTTILMHTDESLYPEPLRFNPDRWIDLEARKALEKTYAPFSKGTRICLGMHLAWAEMYVVIAAVARQFDFVFEGINGADFEMESDQFIIGTKGKSMLKAHVAIYNA